MSVSSLRTNQSEEHYKNAPKGDISKLKSANIGGLRIMNNEYPYDMVHKENQMLVDTTDNEFWSFWVKLGKLLEEGKLDTYDQIIYNLPSKQSQPHVKHAHIVTFKDRRNFKL